MVTFPHKYTSAFFTSYCNNIVLIKLLEKKLEKMRKFKQETNKFCYLQHKRRLSGKKATRSRFKSIFTLFVLVHRFAP